MTTPHESAALDAHGVTRSDELPAVHDDVPQTPPRAGSPRAALLMSIGSVAVPALSWLGVSVAGTVSSSTGNALLLVTLLSCILGFAAFVMGVIARHDTRGVIAIVISVVGFVVSLGTLMLFALAMMLSGLNAAL